MEANRMEIILHSVYLNSPTQALVGMDPESGAEGPL